jgi:hypothetical protein
MNRNAKYVIWDDGLTECAIVFNNHITHADMVFKLRVEPISAGFVCLESNPQDPIINAVAFGESVSLNLKSRPEDSDIIQNMLFPEH